MATTKLLIDLARTHKWLSQDNRNGAIRGSFEQKQDNLPLVLWSINTIPFSEGIKSLCPQNSPWLDTFPASPNYSNMWELTGVLGANGNLTYLVLDDSLTSGQRTFYYWYNSVWVELVGDSVGQYNYFHRKTTVFQNQTVFVHTSGDDFGPSINVTGDVPNANSVFLLDIPSSTVDVYNLTGIALAGKQGIGSYQNYLLLWDAGRLYWSSPTDFTDFTPSIGGGGSTQISDARGDIITIVANTTGLFIYCKTNIVHAAFSGDSSNPWIFREIPNSSGVLIEDGNPVVTTSESSEFQAYMSANGLQIVTPNGVKPFDPQTLEYINSTTTEQKDVGSNEITQKDHAFVTQAASKIRKLTLVGQTLFIFAGETLLTSSELSNNRLFSYNLTTGQIGKHEGDYHSIFPHLNLAKDIDDGVDLYNKVDAFPAQYMAAKRITGLSLRTPVVLDYAGGIERDEVPFVGTPQYREAEILVGIISMSRSSTTLLHSIKPIGQVMRKDSPTTLARIFAYSASTMGHTTPEEFIYNPADGRYYGFIEGDDLMIEVRGDHFYLTALELDVEKGGDL